MQSSPGQANIYTVYKQEVLQASCSVTGSQAPAVLPCNLKQLQNLRFKHLKESRLSRDDLYNLHEIAYDIDGFVLILLFYRWLYSHNLTLLSMNNICVH